MKKRSMGILAVALVLVTAAPAFPQATNSSSEARHTFEFYEGATLSAAWQQKDHYREKYGASYAGFVAFWQDTCKLNPQFPCSDLAYRRIPVGTIFVLPPLAPPAATKAEKAFPAKEPETRPAPKPAEAKPEPTPLKEAIDNTSNALGRVGQKLEYVGKPQVTTATVVKTTGAPWWLVIASVAISALLMVIHRRRGPNAVLARELEVLRSKCERLEVNRNLDRLELETKVKVFETVVSEHLHAVPVPEGMRRIDGSELAYFPYAPSSSKDEPSVLLKTEKQPVKVKNLYRALNRMSDENLRIEGFERIAKPLASEAMLGTGAKLLSA